jgi:ubiquinone/menaquinone biosynthesis C-methylase UbiE
MEIDFSNNIDKGFSSIYDEYEKLSQENDIDIARRNCIRDHVNHYLKPNHKILEINAGSGIDAVYFAQNGNPVLATDIASESEKYISTKIKTLEMTNLQFQNCSFTSLKNIKNEKFDHIFSNFGGLNCIDDLASVFNQFDTLLNPNAFVTLVIMPPYYPWEMATIVKGNKNAFRRLRKNGVLANIENHSIKTFYHSPKQVKKAFDKNFKHIKTRNIGTFYPSNHFASFQKHKSLISKLMKFDTWINRFPFMVKGIGDYFIITFQKTN